MNTKKSFLRGALILAAAGVISRLLGAIYRIPLARLLGAEGMGLYQMAYPIYTTILALATAGVPVAISIMVAQKEAAGLHGDSRRVFRASFGLLFIVGLALSILVFFSSGWLAQNVLKQPKAALPIAAIAPAIFFAGMMSVFRGYFQGYQWMVPTAVSQVVEQIVRITFILLLAFYLFPRGLEKAVAGATFGAVMGGVAGLLVLCGYFAWNRRPEKAQPMTTSGESLREMAGQLVKLAVPVSMGAIVVPLVQMLDAMIVPTRLQAIGYTAARATELYGELSGMASVLINLPTIFTISIATSLVPAVAEALAQKNMSSVKDKINEGLRIAMIIALPSAAGLFILADGITDLLFGVREAGIPLAVLSFSVIVLALFQVTSSSLQGMGHPNIPLVHLIITGLLKVFFNFYLTSVPFLNIRGPAIATTAAFLVGSALNMRKLRQMSGVAYQWGRMLKLTLLTILMTLAVWISYQFMMTAGISGHIATVLAICVGGLVYGLFLLGTRELDWQLIKRLVRIR